MNDPTIAELPTELLLNIFQYLESTDLLNTAKSCRRLNPIAAAFFMKRMGSPDPQTSCVVKPSHRGYADQLTALTINFRLDTIKRLLCILSAKPEYMGHHGRGSDSPAPESRAYRVGDLTWNISRVTRLITRLSSVGSISLVINTWGSHSANLQEFMFRILRLVDTSMSKGCTTFQILHSHPATVPSYQFELVKGHIKGKMAALSHFVMKYRLSTKPSDPIPQGEGWRYRKLYKRKVIPPSKFPLHSQLTKLSISCYSLLIPPFSTWTLGIMKSSPITSLTLSLPSQITKDEFHHYLFPHIVRSLPRLQEIELSFPRFEYLPTISEKLHLLPFLRKITFGSVHSGVIPMTLSTTHTGLQCLTSFTGSSAQTAYLFGPRGFSCPNLEFVNIIIVDFHFHRYSDYTIFAQHFNTFIPRFSEMGIEPCISVCAANHGSRANISSISMLPVEHRAHFDRVSRLTLELPSCNTRVGIQDQIIHALDWLDVFRRLKDLTLVNRHITLDPLTPEAKHAAMFTAIGAKYPDIVTFNVIELPSNPEKYHYHQSFASRNWDWELGDWK